MAAKNNGKYDDINCKQNRLWLWMANKIHIYFERPTVSNLTLNITGIQVHVLHKMNPQRKLMQL